ncbi:Rv1355c family protein [Candidatus Mycobacterium wuenschmannii]|uniref:Rv1355c family protein n=1 Tax=Candidatus Mycobacterium wuenschmannii TaxID=3027808 RepID=A0ABY8VUA5_9MYCO|nr:Rv1355c family protein [Candidatus Mycobacterium wuenschmannii]WIM85717.1 Rv1355c family protein [Candidatus Mycobacterium wuenschmannii]
MIDPDRIAHAAHILDPANPADGETLAALRADPAIEFVDQADEQIAGLNKLRPTPAEAILAEGIRWAYYPWRRSVVAILGPMAFRALRFDRNRNNITVEEQARLGSLTIGVAGLSVGHVIAHTLALEGLFGTIRLADFDHLELSNLNRVPATVFDLGVNKAHVAARRIAELDPYLRVEVFDTGLTVETVGPFLDGLDVLVEECDSLEMKAIARLGARDRGIPVVMATSDRGMIDVERFDHDPERPILHGLVGDLEVGLLPDMSSRDKIPYMLRHLQAEKLSSRATASLIEIDQTLSTWPQLASEVVHGGAAVAEAVRRIGLGEPMRSGRCRIDLGWALEHLEEPSNPSAEPETASSPTTSTIDDPIVAAAVRAPSGGNCQPWRIEADASQISISIAPEYQSAMDVGLRGSALAAGAALFNVRVAAAAHGVLGPADIAENIDGTPLRANLILQDGDDPALAELYRPMLARETNRHRGIAKPIDDAIAELLSDAAHREGARLHLITEQAELSHAAALFAAADRIRYLTPHLHDEMFAELRLAGDPDLDTGLDVHTLELGAGGEAMLEILRRSDVMAHLAEWDAGTALGADMHDRVSASSGLAVITVAGDSLTDYARGGSATEALWILAQRAGISVQPLSPVFIHARTREEFTALSPRYADELLSLYRDFMKLTATGDDEALVLVLRFSEAPPPSAVSRRSMSRVQLRRNAIP